MLLDHHLIHRDPTPLYVGELPQRYRHVPAPVVINVCGIEPRVEPPVEALFTLPFLDLPDASLIPSRSVLERFVDQIHPDASTRATYWHCHAGLNRSNFVVAMYLHRHRGFRISDAISLLRERRGELVLCNGLFEGLLRQWYGGPDEQDFVPFDYDTWASQRRD